MAHNAFTKHLPDEHVIFAEYTLNRGVMAKFCVRLEYKGECVSRFDNAHGYPHQDILGRKPTGWLRRFRKENLIDKVDCRSIGMNEEVFQRALDEFSNHFARYSQRFGYGD
jgi:hypothetical protein